MKELMYVRIEELTNEISALDKKIEKLKQGELDERVFNKIRDLFQERTKKLYAQNEMYTLIGRLGTLDRNK